MLNDMSMFKKMKERITDEVNLATNKLQNLQIIDQLAYSIGQQSRPAATADQSAIYNQQLPELSQTENHQNSSSMQTRSKFSLFNDGSRAGDVRALNEEDELNTSSEISPQHQLFNENSIIRLQNSTSSVTTNNPPYRTHDDNGYSEMVKSIAVINVHELSSDLDDLDEENDDIESKQDCLDVEIDLLTDRPIKDSHVNSHLATNGKDDLRYGDRLTKYKAKYKQVVKAIRDIYSQLEAERREFQLKKQELLEQIRIGRLQLDARLSEDQHHDSISPSDATGANHNHNKTVAKVRDLEKLLAKCKESLKLKNAQIKTLRESLGEIDSFKEEIRSLKKELAELRDAHESWTVSIAENKRVMHQEIESKNSEIDSCKLEIANVKSQLSDERAKVRQLKSTIQELENKLVGTSVAHQKERESLIRELTTDKNNALRQLSRDHELNIERVRLDLEKLVEAAKLESLNKEEDFMKGIEQNKLLQDKNLELSSILEEKQKSLVELQALWEECKKHLDEEKQNSLNLQEELSKKSCLEQQIEALSKEVAMKDGDKSAMTTTEFEYLKNIVHQFMLGNQPLVLARVISAVFKFDSNQVEQICRIQEAIHNG